MYANDLWALKVWRLLTVLLPQLLQLRLATRQRYYISQYLKLFCNYFTVILGRGV